MKLKIKLLSWSAGIPVAMLRETTANKIGVHPQDRILIRINGHKKFTTIVDTVKKGLLKEDEIAVTSEMVNILKLKKSQVVDIELAPIPQSLDFIKKKLHKKTLSKQEIFTIIRDIVSNSLSEAEIALFVVSMYKYGMSMNEIYYLIEAIQETGKKLKLNRKYIVDKHSIGGVAGNRTTPLIVSICAAAGLTIPKSSSRAITSAAGTADTIETIAKVDFPMKKLRKIVLKTNGCMIWGGALGVVPADSKIIHIEKQLKIDPEAQLLASIMSKKLALGSKYIVIDIPYGKSAKVNKKKALELKDKFEKIAKHFNKKMKVVLTDGKQPIGTGIGPALELKDVIKVLDPTKKGPKDLEDKSTMLAGVLFELTKKVKKGKGQELARKMISSGKAFEKFKEIIKAQKGKPKDMNKIPEAKFKKTVLSLKKGKVVSIDNKKINTMARIAGCPKDKYAGLKIKVLVNDKIDKKDPVLTIYSETISRLNEALNYYKKARPILIK
ncbi:thymidine phosphorylase [Candidatus Pacearchaeota archaeon]|nr:thymidine phosphorylase [Candidatus Pacearchaeota archaeon]